MALMTALFATLLLMGLGLSILLLGSAETALAFRDRDSRALGYAARAAANAAAADLRALPSWAAVAQGEVRTYRVDPATRQLLRRDEATGATVPVLDNVTAMTVEYLDAGRLVRITLRLASATSDPLTPALDISFDVRPPNLESL